ncbi:stage II sporulation protein D [Sporolactobacillus shoreae]|uniref:Stage II sporulation protein D n=1 Tax=Sporolactobacillus shoreae TaxID=1465501 RepID=A0A4Z0GRH3_9BACL|nr:stage II sporulation protein D [Sporolactobacillus shoreae]TGA99775.1 stage II sporulation protein D [Sporolactobacillus shoreae]
MKKSATLLLIFALVILVIPAAVVLPFSQKQAAQETAAHLALFQTRKSSPPSVTVSVHRSLSGKTEQVDLNQYLIGVVGSEMPASFQPQALEAQALAARTYIMSRIINNPGQSVTDTVSSQVYHSPQELKRIWGKDYTWKMAKIEKAVAVTDNQVITYHGKLISPVFFSTSNGYTENAKDYWTTDVPYLKSVPSPWDKLSPKYKMEKKISASDAATALGTTLPGNDGELGTVVKKTSTGHIAQYRISGKLFTGREIREKLNLSSTDFTLIRSGGTIIAGTLGDGHDVGMSQYGAQGMAREGKTAEQIVTYFYQGTQVSKMTLSPGKSVAKK